MRLYARKYGTSTCVVYGVDLTVVEGMNRDEFIQMLLCLGFSYVEIIAFLVVKVYSAELIFLPWN